MSEQAPTWATQLQRTLDIVRQQTLTILLRQDDLEGVAMSNQEAINALTGRVDTAASGILAAIEDVRGDIQTLKDQNVDTTALEASVGRLEQAAGSLQGLAAENPPAPTPLPPPEPTP